MVEDLPRAFSYNTTMAVSLKQVIGTLPPHIHPYTYLTSPCARVGLPPRRGVRGGPEWRRFRLGKGKIYHEIYPTPLVTPAELGAPPPFLLREALHDPSPPNP